MPNLKPTQFNELDFDSLEFILKYLEPQDLAALTVVHPKSALVVSQKPILKNMSISGAIKTFNVLSSQPIHSLIEQKNILTVAGKLTSREQIQSLILISSGLLKEKTSIPEKIFESWQKIDTEYLDVLFPLFNRQQRKLALDELLTLFDKPRNYSRRNLIYLQAFFSLMPHINKEEKEQIENVFLIFIRTNLDNMGSGYTDCWPIFFQLLKFFEQEKKEEILGQILSCIINPNKLGIGSTQTLESAIPIFENYFSDEQRNRVIAFFFSCLNKKTINTKSNGLKITIYPVIIFSKFVCFYAKLFNQEQVHTVLDNLLTHLYEEPENSFLQEALCKLAQYITEASHKEKIVKWIIHNSGCLYVLETIANLAMISEDLKPFLLSLFLAKVNSGTSIEEILSIFESHKENQYINEILISLEETANSDYIFDILNLLISLVKKADEDAKDLVLNKLIDLTKKGRAFYKRLYWAIPQFVCGSDKRKQLAIDALLAGLEPLSYRKRRAIICELASLDPFTPFQKKQILRVLTNALNSLDIRFSVKLLVFLMDKSIFQYLDKIQQEKILSMALVSRWNHVEVEGAISSLVSALDDNQIKSILENTLLHMKWGDAIDVGLVRRLDDEDRQRFLDEILKFPDITSQNSRYLLELMNELSAKQRQQVLGKLSALTILRQHGVPLLRPEERQACLQTVIQTIQADLRQDIRRSVLENCISFFMTLYNKAVHERDKTQQLELKRELRQYLLFISPHFTNEEHYLLQQTKIQLQRAEWAMQLEEFKVLVQAEKIGALVALLDNPLLQPFPVEAGFSPALELQTNFIRLGCLYIKPDVLHALNKKLLQEDLKKGLLAKGAIGQALLAYELSLENQNSLQSELESLISAEIRLSLEPLIEYFKPQKSKLTAERGYNRALKRLTCLLNTPNEWYSGCHSKIEELIEQIHFYKEEKRVPLHELTTILEDTCDLLLLKMPVEDYKAKAQSLATMPTPIKIIGGIMLGLAVLVLAGAIAWGIIGAPISAAAGVVLALPLIAGGGLSFFVAKKQQELAKMQVAIAESNLPIPQYEIPAFQA